MAEAVLSNEVYAEAYELIERELYAKWQESRDAADRESLHRFHLMLDKVRKCLELTMQTGKVAQSELERKATLQERLGIKRGASWRA
jgi:hypothetical protein